MGLRKTSQEFIQEIKGILARGGKNVLLVVGAGNSGVDIDRPENHTYPACFSLDNILTVAMIDSKGDLVRYQAGERRLGSNFGARNVDIAALDENFTTDLENGRSAYRLGAGTSSAAPVVTGIAALTLSVKPGLSAIALKRMLMETATRLSGLDGKVACGGMVNAFKALLAASR